MNIRLLSVLPILLACLGAAPAGAQWDGWVAQRGSTDQLLVPRGGAERDRPARGDSPALGPDQAAAAARDATGGKVLGVYPGGDVFHVKLLYRDGRVRMVRVDASSGAVLD